ncbi:MAG: 2-amino-4-hydroxy-6-hydroxymethyldihydropteridine diphosphokinase [Woeseiaceae bacterium]|nr:2-amino-4-hydroxy-6-hydroxymethyldihydropteridine diphosphokinase [Woeseiaceae bacterium]
MSKAHWWPAYVGVGSNLESPVDQVHTAIAALRDIADTNLVAVSALYRSAPLGPTEQPDFVNAVAGLLTQLPAAALLAALHEIERRQGRVRGDERWGPRTIDLDLLAYSHQQSSESGLMIPHPGIAERNFVLLPWRDIAPHFKVPGLADVAGLAREISTTEPRITRIG